MHDKDGTTEILLVDKTATPMEEVLRPRGIREFLLRDKAALWMEILAVHFPKAHVQHRQRGPE